MHLMHPPIDFINYLVLFSFDMLHFKIIFTKEFQLYYLFGKPCLNSIKRRWLKFLSEYEFDINYIRGKENKVVDALSMRVHEMHDTTINMYKYDLCDRILEFPNQIYVTWT